MKRKIMVLVSIIIPVYNGEKYLIRCLNSVYNQSFKDYELIIINDGSTDNTKGILKAYEDSAIIIHQENRGISKTLNRGLDVARGKYVCFLAHDDWYHPKKLEVELFHIQDSKVDVVYSDFYEVKENEITIKKTQDFDPVLLLTQNYINNSALVKKKCLDKLKQTDGYYYDETLTSCMDGDVWIRLSKICNFKHIPIPLSYYYIHENQLSKSMKHIKDRWKVHKRYNRISIQDVINKYFRPILRHWKAKIKRYLKFGG